jgi:hypothetical protein
MNVKRVNNLPPNITAYFTDATLVFPDNDHKRNFNLPLSSNVENWAKEITQNIIKPEVFLTTYLTKGNKTIGQDIENILLYNLNSYTPINSILRNVNKIIIQGMDNINNWPQPNYPHYYFYGVFNNPEHTKYVLYDCNCKTNLFLENNDYQSLFYANRSNNNQVLIQVSGNTRYNKFPKNIVPLNTKFCLKIYINSTFFPRTIDNLKKLIDRIVVFCNATGVIATNKPLVNGNGYDPTDDLLYYCEIEKVDNEETKDNIIFCVCPICESNNENEDNYCCKEKRDNINNFPGFREGDEIEIVREEESINENQDEKEMPKKNDLNNFPGFKKEDEIVDKELNIANNTNNQNNTWNCNARNNPECIIELFKKHIELFNDKNYTVDKKTVEKWLNECKNKNNCERQIKDIGTTLSDMVSLILNGNRTSLTPDIERVLDRPQKGRYRIDIDLLEKYEQSKK